MKSHIETLCVVGIVLLGLLMHQQMRKRIERLENQLGLMRVTYIHTTNGIAEITTGFTISQASNLYNAVKKVQTEPEGLRFKSWEESKSEGGEVNDSSKVHWTQTKERYVCPTCGMTTTHHMHSQLPKTRRLIDAHNGRDGLLCPRSGGFVDIDVKEAKP